LEKLQNKELAEKSRKSEEKREEFKEEIRERNRALKEKKKKGIEQVGPE